jgi:hypothetical protein
MRKVNALVVVGVLLGLPVSTLAQNVRGVVAKEPDSVALRFVDAENGVRPAALTTTAVREAAGLRLATREALAQEVQESERSWPARNPVLFGALVGAGAGAAGTLLVIGCASGSDIPCPGFMWLGAGIGAGVGAAAGLAVSALRR